MTPFVCLAISILLLLFSLVLAIRKQYFWAIVCMLLADLFIVIPWSSTLNFVGSHWGEPSIPQRILYMIGLEDWTNETTGYALSVALGPMAPLYSIVFSLLCVVTPVVAGVAAYSIVTKKVSNWWVIMRLLIHNLVGRGEAKTIILQGMNRRTIAFVRSMYVPIVNGTGYGKSVPCKKSLCIIAAVSKNDREKHSGDIESLRRWPVLITEQSSYELCSRISNQLASFSDIHVCFFSEDASLYSDSESENVSDAVQVIELFAACVPRKSDNPYARFNGQGRPRYHFNIACRGKSDELVFDSIEGREGFDIHVVDEGREVIYDLLWRHPLCEALNHSLVQSGAETDPVFLQAPSNAKANRLIVVLFGWGHYGFEAFRACAWYGQIPSVRLHIHIVDQKPEKDFERYVKHICPGFFQNIDGDKDGVSVARRIAVEELGTYNEPKDSSLFDYTYHETDVRTTELDDCIRVIRETCIVCPNNKASNVQLRPYCIITLGNDDINTDVSIDIKRLFCGEGELPVIDPIIYVDIYDERRHQTLSQLMLPKNASSKAGHVITLNPFGGVDDIFNYGYICDSDVEALALNVNASYSGRLRDNTSPCSAGEKVSNYLEYSAWQMFRLSNIANAMAIRQKLWYLGYQFESDEKNSTAMMSSKQKLQDLLDSELECFYNSALSDKASTIELMARSEHDRWVVFYLAEGWTHESPETSNIFKELGLNDADKSRHDSHLLLKHPYICSFDTLPAVAEEVGRQDPTPYDIYFIGDLAKTVSDERNLSGKSFRIMPFFNHPVSK